MIGDNPVVVVFMVLLIAGLLGPKLLRRRDPRRCPQCQGLAFDLRGGSKSIRCKRCGTHLERDAACGCGGEPNHEARSRCHRCRRRHGRQRGRVATRRGRPRGRARRDEAVRDVAGASTPLLGELVCSNSLRSDDPVAPAGLLKQELRACGSLVIACADAHRVPAGQALAVERFGFARAITAAPRAASAHRIERRRLDDPPDVRDRRDRPLTEGALGEVIRAELGGEMYFYDAIAPIVAAESIDCDHAFRASRWGRDSDRDPNAGASAAGGDSASATTSTARSTS